MRTLSARGMYKKFLLGSVIVLALTTVAVSSAILLQVAELSGFLHTHGHTIPSLGGAVDSASAGSPQTIRSWAPTTGSRTRRRTGPTRTRSS